MDDRKEGLQEKFYVDRVDGSSVYGGKHENCFFYVLDLNHDKHAHVAMKAYIESIKDEYPLLAEDLKKKLNDASNN